MALQDYWIEQLFFYSPLFSLCLSLSLSYPVFVFPSSFTMTSISQSCDTEPIPSKPQNALNVGGWEVHFLLVSVTPAVLKTSERKALILNNNVNPSSEVCFGSPKFNSTLGPVTFGGALLDDQDVWFSKLRLPKST